MSDKGQSKSRVLVVDDQPAIRRLLHRILEDDGYEVKEAKDGAEALALAKAHRFHLVITDLAMPNVNGMELLAALKEACSETVVVLLTAYGTVQSAVEAMKRGAFDYLTKPLSEPEEIRVVAAKAMNHFRLSCGAQELDEGGCGSAFVYRSQAMTDVVRALERLAPTDATVLITGESGTGKEMAARLLHDRSRRSYGPFVAVNCAALPDTLLESELFGHEKGAFTGAEKQRQGRFELASGGTLFLDEIGETSPSLQVRLLRVLQEKAFERVGGIATITVDVRVVAATNRDLSTLVATGRFREDLRYRLDVLPIRLPPLREREGDVVVLAQHFLAQLSRKHGKLNKRFSPAALEELQRHRFPGNVRELRSAVERGVLLGPSDEVWPADLGLDQSTESNTGLLLNLKDLEKETIVRALEKAKGSRRQAAELLGISLRTLHYKLNEYGLRELQD
ncbi:MAG: sigma-54 dependent transcriptional regulator [Myxococcota bacterium]|jgi:DNA-binding NtrC family response regulator|nr:sigma-54 dependent transcriptional regulator [Myxococcota bacterium]